MRIGAIVFIILAVLTAVEYIVATEMESNLIPLVLILQVKAALILWYFMHIARTWLSQGH